MADQVDLIATGVKDNLSEIELVGRLVTEFGQTAENFAELVAGVYGGGNGYNAQTAVTLAMAQQGKAQLESVGLICEIRKDGVTLPGQATVVTDPSDASAIEQTASADTDDGADKSADTNAATPDFEDLQDEDFALDGVDSGDAQAAEVEEALPPTNGLHVVDVSFDDDLISLQAAIGDKASARSSEIPAAPEQPVDAPAEEAPPEPPAGDRQNESDQSETGVLDLSADALALDDASAASVEENTGSEKSDAADTGEGEVAEDNASGSDTLSLSLIDDADAEPLSTKKSSIKGVVNLTSSAASELPEGLSLELEIDAPLTGSEQSPKAVAAEPEVSVADVPEPDVSKTEVTADQTDAAAVPAADNDSQPGVEQTDTADVAATVDATEQQPEPQPEQADAGDNIVAQIDDSAAPAEDTTAAEEAPQESVMESLLKQVAAMTDTPDESDVPPAGDAAAETAPVVTSGEFEASGEPLSEEAVISAEQAMASVAAQSGDGDAPAADTPNSESGESLVIPMLSPAEAQLDELRKSRDQVAKLKERIEEDVYEESQVSEQLRKFGSSKRMARVTAAVGVLAVAGAAGFGVYSSGLLTTIEETVVAADTTMIEPRAPTAKTDDVEQVALNAAMQLSESFTNPENFSNDELLDYLSKDLDAESSREFKRLVKNAGLPEEEPRIAAAVHADSRSTLWLKNRVAHPADSYFDDWTKRQIDLAVFMEFQNRLIQDGDLAVATRLGERTSDTLFSVMGRQQVARAYAEQGNFDAAAEILRVTAMATYGIEVPSERILAIADYSLAEQAMGLHDDAMDTLLKASILARNLGKPQEITVGMIAIADYLQQVGEQEEANDMLTSALAAAQQLPEYTAARDLAIRQVVLKEVSLGQTDRAMQHVELIADPFAAVSAFHGIALKLEQRGETKQARRTIEKAYQIGGEIKDESKRNQLLERVRLASDQSQ